MSGIHKSHRTRFSFDASTYDEICELCGAHDEVPGGFGRLAYPCPASDEKRAEHDIREAQELADYREQQHAKMVAETNLGTPNEL